jgi:hypothetical protein
MDTLMTSPMEFVLPVIPLVKLVKPHQLALPAFLTLSEIHLLLVHAK